MKIERTRNTVRNMMAGSVMKIFQMLMPFAMRTLMIYCMGEEYLGLNSLFTSVLQVLNLAELGVGSAMVYSMYRPIAEDDSKTICALMKMYRTYYRIIGLVVGALGLLLLPFLPHLIKGNIVADLNIYVLYLMNLGATVLSYWMFAYRSSLLSAHQRNDIGSIVTIGTQVLQYMLQAIVILTTHNYYLYVLMILLTQILNNIVAALCSYKMYPQYRPEGEVTPEERSSINSRIRDLFISQIGSVVLSSADTIVISAFLGLSDLAVYQNYFFILTSICGFVDVILNSMLAGIGNSMISESTEKNEQVMRKISILFTWMVFTCSCCFAGMFQPFMKIWMGERLMLSYGMVFSFCVYFIVYEYVRLYNTFKNAAGEWHKDRFRPLISAIVNLVLNIALVQTVGLYGILWSSIGALGIIEIPWLLVNVFTTVYRKMDPKEYARCLLPYVGAGLAFWGITMLAACHMPLDGFFAFFAGGVIAVMIPVSGYLILFRNRPEFGEVLALMEKMTGGRIPVRKILHIRYEG